MLTFTKIMEGKFAFTRNGMYRYGTGKGNQRHGGGKDLDLRKYVFIKLHIKYI
jgi:hypothetical protein